MINSDISNHIEEMPHSKVESVAHVIDFRIQLYELEWTTRIHYVSCHLLRTMAIVFGGPSHVFDVQSRLCFERNWDRYCLLSDNIPARQVAT